jgi:quaternary ammonium compound-resistance protein SugE
MAWIVLFLSGLLETVWAIALKQSDGFSKLGWVALFLVAAVGSLIGLAFALKTLPVGSAYAVWTGIGTVGAALVGVLALGEPATAARAFGIALIVGGIVTLRFAGVE